MKDDGEKGCMRAGCEAGLAEIDMLCRGEDGLGRERDRSYV